MGKQPLLLRSTALCTVVWLVQATHAQLTPGQYNLRYLGDYQLNLGNSVPYDVNNQNIVVGSTGVDDPPGQKRAYYWDINNPAANQSTTLISLLPFLNPGINPTAFYARGINEEVAGVGQSLIVGYAGAGAEYGQGDYHQVSRALIWRNSGSGYVASALFGSGHPWTNSESVAYGIDSSSRIVGVLNPLSTPQAFYFDDRVANSNIVLPPPQAPNGTSVSGTWAWSIASNDQGEVFVAGTAMIYDGTNTRPRAVRWKRDVFSTWYVQILSQAGTIHSGEPSAEGYGVNSSGQVVGYYDASPGQTERRAFYWDGSSPIVTTILDPSGNAVRSIANAINDAGVAVGANLATMRPFVAEMWSGAPRMADIRPPATSDAAHGYVTGQMREAFAINNSDSLRLGTSRTLASIAVRGSSSSGGRRQSVLARGGYPSNYSGAGNPGLAIGGVRGSVVTQPLIVAGTEQTVGIDTSWAGARAGGNSGTPIAERQEEAKPTAGITSSLPLVDANDQLVSTFPCPISLLASGSPDQTFKARREDAGRSSIVLTTTVPGYQSRSTTFSIAKLATKVRVEDAGGLIGATVNLRARLSTVDLDDTLFTGARPVRFEVQTPTATYTVSGVTQANGVVSVPWQIPTDRGTGNWPIRAYFDGFESESSYPWLQICDSQQSGGANGTLNVSSITALGITGPPVCAPGEYFTVRISVTRSEGGTPLPFSQVTVSRRTLPSGAFSGHFTVTTNAWGYAEFIAIAPLQQASYQYLAVYDGTTAESNAQGTYDFSVVAVWLDRSTRLQQFLFSSGGADFVPANSGQGLFAHQSSIGQPIVSDVQPNWMTNLFIWAFGGFWQPTGPLPAPPLQK